MLLQKYVGSNDLGPVSNGIHGRWDRTLLRSLKRTLRRLRRRDFFGFDVTTYNPSRGKQQRRSRSYTNCAKDPSGLKVSTKPTQKRTFKFGVEVPKNWKDIIIIDEAAVNTL